MSVVSSKIAHESFDVFVSGGTPFLARLLKLYESFCSHVCVGVSVATLGKVLHARLFLKTTDAFALKLYTLVGYHQMTLLDKSQNST